MNARAKKINHQHSHANARRRRKKETEYAVAVSHASMCKCVHSPDLYIYDKFSFFLISTAATTSRLFWMDKSSFWTKRNETKKQQHCFRSLFFPVLSRLPLPTQTHLFVSVVFRVHVVIVMPASRIFIASYQTYFIVIFTWNERKKTKSINKNE